MSQPDQIAVLLGSFALIFLVINLVYAVKVVEYLKERGEKAHFYAIRWMIFRYLKLYKEHTLKETGKIGPYYNMIRNLWLLFVPFIVLALWFSTQG